MDILSLNVFNHKLFDMRVFFVFIILAGAFQQISAQSVKFLSYNIRLDIASDGENSWPNRKDFLVAQLKFYGPDIIGTQEALPGQVAYIDEQLTDYHYVGVGREGTAGEHTVIFYRKDRFKLLEENTFWLSETPGEVSMGWDAAYLRVCTYARFQDKKTKKRFWIFNTHLDNSGLQARMEGVKLIVRKMDEIGVSSEPVVLMGDFNALPESEVIGFANQYFTSAEELSVVPPFGPHGTFNGFNFGKPIANKIDYVFVKRPVRCAVLKYAVLTDSDDWKYPSDHFPVFAEIRF